MAVAEMPSFFQSLPQEAVDQICAATPHRQFPVGGDVVAEGDRPDQMYVITSGVCGVFVKDRDGAQCQIGQIGPGATIAEMALFAGQAEPATSAPATLRALTELDVIALDAPGFYSLAAGYPQLVHNVGAILSHRLTRSYQHAVEAEHGRVTILADHGAPPLLAYALACSVAWHTRGSTVLVVVGDRVSDDLRALADGTTDTGVGAQLRLVAPEGEYDQAALPGTIEELTHSHEHVLVLTHGQPPAGIDGHTVRLADASVALPADANGRAGHTVRGWSGNQRTWRPDRNGVVHVPPLGLEDEQALRKGVLSTETAAGKALGWIARDVCGLKVGLALGAGSVRGYAHYGVLRFFERIGLEPDYITGTSIGGIIASSYALGFTAEEAARNMEETSGRAFRLTAPVHSLLSNAGVYSNFRAVTGDTRIEDLDVPLALVAADLTTAREVVFRRGLLRLAVLASMAIPGIYPPVRMGDHVLVDGGVVNPVPISVAGSMGADVVIGVSLNRPVMKTMEDIEAVEGGGRIPSLLRTMTRSVEVMQGRIGHHATAAAAVLIEPDFSSSPALGLHAFRDGRPYIAPGEAAAEAVLPDLVASLPWLGV